MLFMTLTLIASELKGTETREICELGYSHGYITGRCTTLAECERRHAAPFSSSECSGAVRPLSNVY